MKKLKIKQTIWNLKPLFKDDNDPKMEKQRKIVEKESYKFIKKWERRSDYLKTPKILKRALDEYERWQRSYGTDGNEGAYFYLRTCQNQNDSKLKAKLNKIQDSSNKILNDIQFFTLKIAKISPKHQKKFLEYNGLKDYKHFLERLFTESKYLLSEPEEKILNLKSTPAYTNWVDMTAGFLAKEERKVLGKTGKKITKNFSEILALTNNKDRKVRDSAAQALNDIFKKNADIAEAEMNSIMADKKINDELRGLSRPDLAMHISDDIDSRIADVLIKTSADRFDISKRYYRLKARLFNVKKLKYHERNVEYGHIQKKYSYNEAVAIVSGVFENIDKDFAHIFKNFVSNGQVDVYPGKGKAVGGFCFHYLISQPIYILMNFTGRLDDVFTIVHEAGHGINYELIKKRQNALNFDTPLFTAEVASKLMEGFTFEEMFKTKNEELRLAMMMKKLNDEIIHIFRSAADNRFEFELHKNFRQKGYLSKEEIGQLYKKHMATYMDNHVEQTPGSENWWMHISHLRVFFYNYQYAAGILMAESLQSFVKEDPQFIEKVKEFLSAGLSDSPKNIFTRLGIDITDRGFWERGINEVEDLLEETEKLAKKLGKI
jgi:oligoendopeptidase F